MRFHFSFLLIQYSSKFNIDTAASRWTKNFISQRHSHFQTESLFLYNLEKINGGQHLEKELKMHFNFSILVNVNYFVKVLSLFNDTTQLKVEFFTSAFQFDEQICTFTFLYNLMQHWGQVNTFPFQIC